MKILKSKKFLAILVGIIAVAGIALAVAFTSNSATDSAVEDELLNVIKGANQATNDSVTVPIDTLKENLKNGTDTILTKDQAQPLSNEADANIIKYYSEDYAANLSSNSQSIFNYYTQYSFANIPMLSMTIRMGTLDYNVTSTVVDGDTATVEFTSAGWLISLEKSDDGSNDYDLWMIFSKDTDTDYLVQKDGEWILNREDIDQEFAPDNYNYDKGHYATVEDALNAAEKVDPEAENPF